MTEKKQKEGPKKERVKPKGEKLSEVKGETPVKAIKKPLTPSLFAKKFRAEWAPALIKQFNFTNVMECPQLTKIVVNTCLKEATQDRKVLERAAEEVALITGQKPMITRAKKSIANFKLREGQEIGCRVTLRRKNMYEFFNRLVNVALPRVRDFKGISPNGFDGRGNYTLGLTEQSLFPEIPYSKVEKVFGMNVTFVTTAKKDAEGKALLKIMGLPFRE